MLPRRGKSFKLQNTHGFNFTNPLNITFYMFPKIVILLIALGLSVFLSGCKLKEPYKSSSIPLGPDPRTFDRDNPHDLDNYIAWRHAILDEEARRNLGAIKRAKISFKRELSEDEFVTLMEQPEIFIVTVYIGHGCFGGAAPYGHSQTLQQFLVEIREQDIEKFRFFLEETSSTDNTIINYLNFLESKFLPLQGADIEASALKLKEFRDQNADKIWLVDLLEQGSFFLLPYSRPLLPGC